GLVRQADQVWIATTSELDIYQMDGRLVDRVGQDFLPAQPLRHLGMQNEHLVVDTSRGTFTTTDGINWPSAPSSPKIAWSRAQPLTEAEQASLKSVFAPSLPVLRIVADIHSGRLFGHYGPLVTDALAASLLLLVGTGVWLVFKKS